MSVKVADHHEVSSKELRKEFCDTLLAMAAGDEKARLVYEAFVYSVAKEICSYAAAFEGKVDRVVLTGGIAHSDYVVREVGRMTAFLAPLEIVAGEFEMEALALGALRVLRGEEEAREY